MSGSSRLRYKRLMRIGELAQRTGVSERSLRYYEQQGLLAAVTDAGWAARLRRAGGRPGDPHPGAVRRRAAAAEPSSGCCRVCAITDGGPAPHATRGWSPSSPPSANGWTTAIRIWRTTRAVLGGDRGRAV